MATRSAILAGPLRMAEKRSVLASWMNAKRGTAAKSGGHTMKNEAHDGVSNRSLDLDHDLGEGLTRQAGASMPTRSRRAAAEAMRRRANDQCSTYTQQEWISAEEKIKGQLRNMERIRQVG